MRLARFSICGLSTVVEDGLAEHRLLAKISARTSTRDLEGAIREMDRAWRSSLIDHSALAPIYARLLVRQGRNWGTVIGLLSQRPDELSAPSRSDLALAFERSGQIDLATQLRAKQRQPLTLDGRAAIRGTRIHGWVSLGWDARRPIRLEVRDENGKRARILTDQELPRMRWGFSFEPRRIGLHGEQFEIAVRLPDRSLRALPDTPLLTARFARASMRKLTPKQRTPPAKAKPPVSIVIPVYRDRERTLACIDAVLETTRDRIASIIVIDDASPEPQISADLDALAARGQIRLLRNPANLGFAASVNRGIDAAGEADVVLLNSDVVVFGDWLERLRRAAYTQRRIGTVTSLSDDDSIAGYIGSQDGEDPVARAEKLHRIAAVELSGQNIDLPVGVGFCLYIRRDCWRDTGRFDAAVFSSGYGEEADFCMRAGARQWRHLLATDVFVHHAGGKSFGARRQALLERSWRLLNLRHRGYADQVRRFLTRDPLLTVRRRLETPQLAGANSVFVVILTLARGGGVERFVDARCSEIRARGALPLLVQPGAGDDMSWCALVCPDLGLSELRYRIPSELDALGTLLESLQIASIEFQHFLGLDPRVIAMVQRLGVPIDTYIHDYSWVCPRVTMIDGSGTYCGEPSISHCQRCVSRHGSNLPESISVAALRRRSAKWLRASRRVIAPSQDTAARLRRYIPDLPIDVEPHETFIARNQQPTPPVAGERVRVAIIGAIGHHKGYKVLLDCARDAARRRLDLEFVVIGYSEDDQRLMRSGRITLTGRYRDSEVGHLLRREGAQVVFLPSVWPETWCYTLSHAIASGLPVVAFDIGAMGERLRAEGCGTLLPLGLSPREINDLLMGLGRAPTRPDATIFGSNP
jgi:GT2 family glycosyltransferase